MWARVENGIVVETTTIDPSGRYVASVIWMTCPSTTKQGYVYANNTFSAPPAVSLVAPAGPVMQPITGKLPFFPNDAAAKAGGVADYQLYRSTAGVQQLQPTS